MIKAEDYLKNYIKKTRPYLDSFLVKEESIARTVSPIAVKMIKTFHEFIGGKRLRGALTYGSYQMFGGKEAAEIIKASVIIEIIHAFGLIHDDIMDEDKLRRGRPTVHVQYENAFKKLYRNESRKNPEHFGLSLALSVGDLGPFLANLILCETNFSDKTKIEFLKTLSETIVTTVYGQALDVHFEAEPRPTYREVLQVHLYKTANYTVTGPLRYGAILAGEEQQSEKYKALSLYGTPVGIAFQLRDDELGMFSTEKKLGKPISSDLREGKNTLLFLEVFEKGTKEEKKFLRATHGKKTVSLAEMEKVKRIIVETGALEHSKKEGRRLVELGKRAIPRITKDKKYQELLEKMADYVIERDS